MPIVLSIRLSRASIDSKRLFIIVRSIIQAVWYVMTFFDCTAQLVGQLNGNGQKGMLQIDAPPAENFWLRQWLEALYTVTWLDAARMHASVRTWTCEWPVVIVVTTQTLAGHWRWSPTDSSQKCHARCRLAELMRRKVNQRHTMKSRNLAATT